MPERPLPDLVAVLQSLKVFRPPALPSREEAGDSKLAITNQSMSPTSASFLPLPVTARHHDANFLRTQWLKPSFTIYASLWTPC